MSQLFGGGGGAGNSLASTGPPPTQTTPTLTASPAIGPATPTFGSGVQMGFQGNPMIQGGMTGNNMGILLGNLLRSHMMGGNAMGGMQNAMQGFPMLQSLQQPFGPYGGY